MIEPDRKIDACVACAAGLGLAILLTLAADKLPSGVGIGGTALAFVLLLYSFNRAGA